MLEGTETVLVVDDDELILDLAEVALKRYGYTVILATSGPEALQMLEQSPDMKIDVAVIDVVMPIMDGFELVDHLREIRPELPIMYMSAYPARAELRPEQTRSVPFVPKPFTPPFLIEKIRKALDASRTA